MKRFYVLLLAAVLSLGMMAKDYEVKSPDGAIIVRVKVEKKSGIFLYSMMDGKEMLSVGPLQLHVEGQEVYGESPKVRKTHRAVVKETFSPVVKEKRANVLNHYHELGLLFKKGFRLDIRVFNDGWAYRFNTMLEGRIQVNSEPISFTFSNDPMIWFPTEESFFTHSERLYENLIISDIPGEKFASLPALVDREDGYKILITETNLEDYPGLYLSGDDDNNGLAGIFPAFVLEEKLYRDRDIKPIKRADYLAKTNGTRVFPWRVMAFAREEMELLGNDIVLRLAPECRIDDTDWIKPGMVAWDWWNANNNAGVPFESGVNTATYKYHIDFAADYGLDYVILDEGWSVPGDLFQINPDCDMDEICSYAKQKNVGIILWVLWNALDKDLEPALDKFAEWGVKGIKVDFMQRDDQAMVNYYWKVAKAAADRKMLVDFHGSYKPAGIRGAYPNCVNREGVKGLENAKWSELITPDHDCTIPFIRMVAGPIDYTPGAMRNAQKINYSISFTRPMSMGTRCHQLALYVIFDSPLQMLCDAPSYYYREPLAMEFLSQVPTVWDETIPLEGRIGDYIGVARKSGDDWYIGFITDWTEREFEVDLDFLPEGEYELIEFEDSYNSARHAEDFRKEVHSIKSGAKIKISMAPGGGYAGILKAL